MPHLESKTDLRDLSAPHTSICHAAAFEAFLQKYTHKNNNKSKCVCTWHINKDELEQIAYLCQPSAPCVHLFESMCFCSLVRNKCIFFSVLRILNNANLAIKQHIRAKIEHIFIATLPLHRSLSSFLSLLYKRIRRKKSESQLN